jgi:hypothetical protein
MLGTRSTYIVPCLSLFSHKLFPINFLFAKLSHHLLGTWLPPSYNLACNLIANSCLTCPTYPLSVSASFRSRGPSNAWFSGNPGSPGKLNCSNAKLVRNFDAAEESIFDLSLERQSERKRMP